MQKQPQRIIVFKVGNIGDIVCAVPALIAIRRAYRQAKITLLTSPGKIGSLGAKELLTGAWYIDELKAYYSEDISTSRQKANLIQELRGKRYDLFIQLPDDLVDFKTLIRNMFFAKAIGVKSAFGFKIRTIQLFKKAQVDYLFNQTEVESLLKLLKENGIPVEKAEFDFPISPAQTEKAARLLREKWGGYQSELVVALSVGGKRETNQWPIERFALAAKYLQDKHKAKIIGVGGPVDLNKAEVIGASLREENFLNLVGRFDLLETIELLKLCSFLISNSTGTIHLAAAVGLPAVGLYTIRDVLGRWYPYGGQHQVLAHRFLACDYSKEACIKKSIDLIAVEEVVGACEKIIKTLNQKS